MGNCTAACLHSLRVIVGDIVVDPSQVRVRLFRRRGCLKVLQATTDHAIPQQAREQRDLQGEPVLGLTDVEDVAAVGGASY